MIAQQDSIVLSEDNSSPQRLFLPLFPNSRHLQCPLATADFLRMRDGKRTTLEIFKNMIISVWQEGVQHILFENHICFGYDLSIKKIWFKNSQSQAKETYQSENKIDLQQFVQQLKNKCPQQNFFNFYQLLEKTGNGSKSQVYTARRKSDKTIFAVKVQKYNSSLKRQVEILRQLQHPNIIYFRQYFIQTDNKVYIAMDYQDGGCLLDIIQSKQHISSKQKIKIFTDMLNALQFLRIKGIVHRDIKPQNILYSKKDKVYKIADFGMSRKQGQKLDRISGTPGYMAPQTLNSQPNQLQADLRSDIYSMGLVFYQILTYQQYYFGDSAQQIIKKNKQSISLKKKAINPAQIKDLEYALLEKMIRSQPANRKNSCQILKSSTFNKLNKIHGLQYLSSTSPSKKLGSANSEKEIDDGFVESFWKLLRMKSWSN